MDETNLERLRAIVSRADMLLRWELGYLRGYWNAKMHCFHTNKEASDGKRFSVTNTCFGVFAMLRSPGLLGGLCQQEDPHDLLLGVARGLLSVGWTSEKLPENNAYTAPIVLTALSAMAERKALADELHGLLRDSSNQKKVNAGLESLLERIEKHGALSFEDYDLSAYLSYWGFRALSGAKAAGLATRAMLQGCEDAVRKLVVWAETEVHRQIAFHAADDVASFDVTQLAYATQILVAGMKLLGKRLNARILSKSVDVVFGEQQADGLWPRSHALFHYGTRGSVYTFTYEMLDVFLELSEQWAALFEPHLGRLERAIQWAEQNRRDDTPLKGWRSNHLHFHGGPEAWSTAAVFMSVRRIRRLATSLLNEQVLSHFRAVRFPGPNPGRLRSDHYDSDVPIPGGDKRSLIDLLKEHLVDPHLPSGNGRPSYSAVFFGPPGTGKTTWAKAVAEALGWPFIYLQTSDFMSEGSDYLISKARRIFDELCLLDKAVVLFDEVEEFVRKREDEGNPQNRMITASMLSLVQELRGKEKVILILATNHLKEFDNAVIRPGRFDLLLLVAPPSQKEKRRMFSDVLARERLPQDQVASYVSVFSAFLRGCFEKQAQFFSFAEWRALVEKVVGRIRGGEDLTESLLKRVLDERMDGVAMDEALRQSFIESSKYVRVP